MKLGDGAAVAFALAGLILVAFTLRDRPWWFGYALLMGSDTEYAQGYREWRFQSLEIGMKSDEVFEMVGAPLTIRRLSGMPVREYDVDPEHPTLPPGWPSDPSDCLMLDYSRQTDQDISFFLRIVVICGDGKVRYTVSKFFVD